VRPLALAPGGALLYALNTADDRLEILMPDGEGLKRVGEVGVGLRPVALAVHGQTVWVSNHLSDTVSVVDVSEPAVPRVIHTLKVGDEPRDIVLGGPAWDRVYVASALRGSELEPGIGRAEIWVFSARRPGDTPQRLTLFGTKPRALAVSPDGRRVYAGVFLSGNGTTSTGAQDLPDVDGRKLDPGWRPDPDAAPLAGAIVQRAAGRWVDESGRDWSASIPFELPDYDVFVIDAGAAAPAVVNRVSSVGTVLFNAAVHPRSGELWVTNTDARNFVRHEPRLRGAFASNRVTRILDPAGAARITAVDLNPHLAGRAPPSPPAVRALSLAQPSGIVFKRDGARAYVAAFASRKIAVLDDAARVAARIDVGAGPAGVALDEARGRLYVLNHLDATLSVVSTASNSVTATLPLRHDPTPRSIAAGRRFLYDAESTSGHGDLACATCHVFGDVDGLAWDLGVPDGSVRRIPTALWHEDRRFRPRQRFHPLKGPTVTQSFRGLAGAGPMHWRGDRHGSGFEIGSETAAFLAFDVAFVDLMGLDHALARSDMEDLARFALSIRYPPNPTQRLDRTLTPAQRAGFEFFTGPFPSDARAINCEGCHALPLGTNGRINFEGPQAARDMKAAHLRNVYQKVGRFNVPGPQVAGFGLLHDGSVDTVVHFLQGTVFNFPGATEVQRDTVRRDLSEFVMAFDTGMAPAVGRQVTLRAAPGDDQHAALSVLVERAGAGECDLIARGRLARTERGWLLRHGRWLADDSGQAPLGRDDLLRRYRAADEPLTFTCVPPDDGVRSALDRDGDGHRDGDERRAGSDPADAGSVPRGTAEGAA